MKVIPISGKAGHGKDTLAGFLKEDLERRGKKVLVTHYGDLIKYVCKTFFNWNGLKDQAGRTLLQHVGTEGVRSKSPDYWVRFVCDMLTFFNGEWDYVLIPDARFPNEIDMLREKGFDVTHIRITRPEFNMLTEEQQKHKTETALDDYHDNRVEIINDGTAEDLRNKAGKLIENIL